jgi:hypothetical protein
VAASSWTSRHFCSGAERVEFLNFDVSAGSHEVIVLNARAQNEDINNDLKDCNCEELQQAFGHFLKYRKKILLNDTNLKISKSTYLKTDSW